MLTLTEEQVRELLPMREAIRLVRESFAQLRAGTAVNQLRRRLFLSSGTVLHAMAGANPKYLGTKIYATNARAGAANFFFLLFDAADTRPLALMQANWLGQIRTGAASGVATDLLAPPDARSLAIIGSGFQARSQLEAVLAVRPEIDDIRVWSRHQDKRERFAAETTLAFDKLVVATSTAEEAVRGAAIVVTATWAKDPVLEDSWITAPCHINAMGSNNAQRRELPAELVHRAGLIAVDSAEQAKLESGDLVLAGIDWNSPRLKELAQCDGGSPGGITIFKSNGLGIQDVAVGAYVYEEALRTNTGGTIYS
jgi:ornithine cyclodeaminase/alanine dehydrogenase-like protein (mu-crystallin family)